MHIRYWTSRFNRDDIEDVAPLLALALAERGHDLTVIAPQTDHETGATGDERLAIHRISTAAGRTVDLPQQASGATDLELVETCGPLSEAALDVSKRSSKPLVATIRCPLPDSTQDASDPEGALLRAADAIVVDSDALAGQLRAFVPEQAARTTVVRPGLPMTGLAPGPRLLKRPTLLCVGPLTRASGFDVAIDALADIRSRFGTAELIIAGCGPERDALVSQAASLGLADAVQIREAVPAARLPALVNQINLVLLPTRVPVTSSAMAILAGQLIRPVIASEIGGLSEVIEQHGSGLLVVSEDPAAFAGVARRLLSEPGAAADLGRRGRVLARERFGWDRFVDEIEATLSSAVEGATQSPPQRDLAG